MKSFVKLMDDRDKCERKAIKTQFVPTASVTWLGDLLLFGRHFELFGDKKRPKCLSLKSISDAKSLIFLVKTALRIFRLLLLELGDFYAKPTGQTT